MEAQKYFSSYFIVLIILVGIYMLCVQGPQLIAINHLKREGRLLKWTGTVYIAVGVIGILLWIF